MSAESIIYSALSADATLAALVGGRIYPMFLPQDKETPAVIFRSIGEEKIATIHSARPVGERVEVEIAGFAETFDEAEAIGTAIQEALITAAIAPTGRRPEIDEETQKLACVITCVVWP